MITSLQPSTLSIPLLAAFAYFAIDWALCTLRQGPVRVNARIGLWLLFVLSMLLAPPSLFAEDRPVAYLQDHYAPNGQSRVYEFTDPKTLRRWLVVKVSNGNGGYNIAAVEATLTPADHARLAPRPAPRPAVPQVKDTTSYWLYAKTYGPYRESYREAGWELVSTGPGNPPGSTVTKLRRKNPDYVEPEGPELVLPEKQTEATP